MILHTIQCFHAFQLGSPPQKVVLKKSKSCAKLVAEVAQQVALKLHTIWLIFGCKMLLWPFGTLPNFGDEQQNNIYRYYNNNNTLIYIAPACRMTSEALA